MAPTPGHTAVNAWQRLLVSPSASPIDPSPADLYAQLGRAASLASSPSTRGPTPSRFQPAIGPEARVGRFPARSWPPAPPLLHSSSLARGCVARSRRRRSRPRSGSPGTHSRTLRRADPGDTLGAGGGAGGAGPGPRGGGGSPGLGEGWAHRPPALRMRPSCRSSPPPPGAGRKPLLSWALRRRGEGKGEGSALGQRAGMVGLTRTWQPLFLVRFARPFFQ